MAESLKIVTGLLLVIVGLYVYFSDWFDYFFANQFMLALKLVLGNLPGLVIAVGLIVFLLGMSDVNN